MKSRKPKTSFVGYRVDAEERAELAARARREGFATLSEFARVRMNSAGGPAISTTAPVIAEASQADRELADQVRRIGVNLNQIAYQLNILNVPAPAELAALLDEIRRYMQFVRARDGL